MANVAIGKTDADIFSPRDKALAKKHDLNVDNKCILHASLFSYDFSRSMPAQTLLHCRCDDQYKTQRTKK